MSKSVIKYIVALRITLSYSDIKRIIPNGKLKPEYRTSMYCLQRATIC